MPTPTDSLGSAGPLLRAADPGRHDPTADAERLIALRRAVDIRTRGVRQAPARPRRSRRSVLVGIPAGVVAAGAVVAVVVAGAGHPGTGPDRPISGTVAVQAGDPAGVPGVLDRIATAASSQPVVVPGVHDFVYVKSRIAFTEQVQERTMDGPGRLDAVHDREVWLSQDPDDPEGLIREGGQDIDLHGTADDPTVYAALAQLPTDPVQLLAQIRTQVAGRAGGADYAAFDQIGQLVHESIAPPDVAAALYRAVALIPGVEVVPDAVDAAGRHGVGVALISDGQRYEWIFDPDSYVFLGERDYLVQDTTLGPAGMLTGLSAVLARGVADEPGDEPDADHLVD